MDPLTRLPGLRASALSSDTGRAVGLGVLAMAANGISLAFTVVFARVLGSDGYGSLIALTAAFLILALPGQALQVAVARDVSRQVDGHDPSLAANVRRWARTLVVTTLVVALVAALLRHPLAGLIGVHLEWAAAATLPMGCAWLLLCIERGVFQGIGSYGMAGGSLVLEASGRFVFAFFLVALGLDATGAFLGQGASVVALSLILFVPLNRRLARLGAAEAAAARPLADVLRAAAVPLVALGLFALLQNLDVILVRNVASEDVASDYAAVSVAAKALVWIAIGIGLFLLPEATRRTARGEDGRPVFLRALAVAGTLGLGLTAAFAVVGRPVLEIAFGEGLADGAAALPWLTLAMGLLAMVYLAVQFLLALRRVAFLAMLGIAAVVELAVLGAIGPDLVGVTLGVLAVEVALALGVIASGIRAGHPGHPVPVDSDGSGLLDGAGVEAAPGPAELGEEEQGLDCDAERHLAHARPSGRGSRSAAR